MAALSDVSVTSLAGGNYVDYETINNNFKTLKDRADTLYDRLLYKSGDEITFGYFCTSGYLTSSKTSVRFNVPLSKPVVASGVDASGYFRIRSNEQYILGDSDTYKPCEIASCKLNSSKDTVRINLTVDELTRQIDKIYTYYCRPSSTSEEKSWSHEKQDGKTLSSRYLYRYQKIYYSDGTTETLSSARVGSGKFDSGTEIVSIRDYAMSKSKSASAPTASSSGWSSASDGTNDSVHGSASTPYVYTYSKIKYKVNGTTSTLNTSVKHVATWTGSWNNEVIGLITRDLTLSFT